MVSLYSAHTSVNSHFIKLFSNYSNLSVPSVFFWDPDWYIGLLVWHASEKQGNGKVRCNDEGQAWGQAAGNTQREEIGKRRWRGQKLKGPWFRSGLLLGRGKLKNHYIEAGNSLSTLSLGIIIKLVLRDFLKKCQFKINKTPNITGANLRYPANHGTDCREDKNNKSVASVFFKSCRYMLYLYSVLQQPQSSHLFTTCSFVLCTLFNDVFLH